MYQGLMLLGVINVVTVGLKPRQLQQIFDPENGRGLL